MAISERVTRPNLAIATSRGGGMLITDLNCPAAVQEAYKQTYLNVRFAMLGATGGTLLVSAIDNTATAAPLAANLAIRCAQEGERVVLIDADPYTPSLDSLFALSTQSGFSTVIRHEGVDVTSALHEVEIQRGT